MEDIGKFEQVSQQKKEKRIENNTEKGNSFSLSVIFIFKRGRLGKRKREKKVKNVLTDGG